MACHHINVGDKENSGRAPLRHIKEGKDEFAREKGRGPSQAMRELKDAFPVTKGCLGILCRNSEAVDGMSLFNQGKGRHLDW